MPAITVCRGDLLDQDVEVIVNSWNRNFIPWWLLLPQGVSGHLKKRAGRKPFRELAGKGVLPCGGAVLTGSGKLDFKAIIHVAALNCLWISNKEIVEKSVRNALNLAVANGYQLLPPNWLWSKGGLNKSTCLDLIKAVAGKHQYRGVVIIVIYDKRIHR